MKFTGSGKLIEVAEIGDIGTKDFTVEGWFYLPLEKKDKESCFYVNGRLYNPKQLELFEETMGR